MENLNTRQAVLKRLNAPGFRGLPRPVEVSRPSIDRHISSTLEIGRVYFYVIIKPPPISFTLYRTQEILYGRIAVPKACSQAVLLSFEVALMSVSMWVNKF